MERWLFMASLATSRDCLKGGLGPSIRFVVLRGVARLPPFGTMPHYPVRQRAFEPDVPPRFFRFNPFVPQDFFAFSLEFPVKRRVRQKIIPRWSRFVIGCHNHKSIRYYSVTFPVPCATLKIH